MLACSPGHPARLCKQCKWIINDNFSHSAEIEAWPFYIFASSKSELNMFGIFPKKPQYPLDAKYIEFVQGILVWLGSHFGHEYLTSRPFYFPPGQPRSLKPSIENEDFKALFLQICERFELDPDTIRLRIFDDKRSNGGRLRPGNPQEFALGLYFPMSEDPSKKCEVHIARSVFADEQLLIGVLAHELSHAKLLGDGLLDQHRGDMEIITDISLVFFGYGLPKLNRIITKGRKAGYVSEELVAFTLALVAYIRKEDDPAWAQYIEGSNLRYFRRSLKFLKYNKEAKGIPAKISQEEVLQKLIRQAHEHYVEGNLEAALESWGQTLDKRPEDLNALNGRGYTLMRMRKYEAAVADFEKAIELNPQFPYPYNNRGLIHALEGRFEAAEQDMEKARRLGGLEAYYLIHKGILRLEQESYKEALEFFIAAQYVDPEATLVHYYAGLAYQGLGMPQLATTEFQRSADRGEQEGEEAISNLGGGIFTVA